MKSQRSPFNRTEYGNIQRLLSFTLAALTGIFLAGCDTSTDPGTNGPNGPGEPAPNEVWMSGSQFTPGTRSVEPGTTVTWINQSDEIHTVTSGSNGNHDQLFDSGNISPGETYSYTFQDEGVYDYFCIPHVQMGMTGTIIVGDN